MSFWPFPTTLRAELRHGAARGPVIELGAGEGDLARRLRSLDLDVVTLDRDPRLPADVLGDLRRLPFADRSAGVLVLGDVLRHLDPVSRDEAAWSCRHVLAREGRVVVLEDDPEARDRAEANYRETLAMLSDLVARRGPARRIDRLTGPWRGLFGEPVARGASDNETPVRDPLEPIRWMRSASCADRVFRERLDRLAASVETDGMRYGRYCFEVFAEDRAP